MTYPPAMRIPRWQSATIAQQQSIMHAITATFPPETPVYIRYGLIAEATQVFAHPEPPPWHRGVLHRTVAIEGLPGAEIFEDGLRANMVAVPWAALWDIQADETALAPPPPPAYHGPPSPYYPAASAAPLMLCPACGTALTIVLADGRPYHPPR